MKRGSNDNFHQLFKENMIDIKGLIIAGHSWCSSGTVSTVFLSVCSHYILSSGQLANNLLGDSYDTKCPSSPRSYPPCLI